ncbi:MAG TPA: iron ABC transporter permease [Roseiflexaceae bacterium]|nr:iron ABC transporter permease [Roseiflexaceae bacterium]
MQRGIRPPLVLILAAAAVAVLMFLPLAYLLVRVAGSENAVRVLQRHATWEVLFGSATLAATTACASMAIALPLAWLTMRTDLPLRRFWSVVTLLPLAIPSYIGSFALIVMLGPKGELQRLLAPLGVERLPEIYGFGGAALALTLFGYPYVLITLRAALRRLDPATEEAARALGDSRARAFWRVTLPQLRPALAAGGLLVALYTLSDFGAVSLMQYNAFTRAIYLQYRASFNREGAAVLALMLVALTVVLLVAEARTRGRAQYYRSGTCTIRPQQRVALGRWRWPALCYCALVTGIAVVLPLGAMIGWLTTGLRNNAVAFGPLAQLTFNSLLASVTAAVIAVAAALPIVILAVRFPGRSGRLFERAAYIGYALPGVVIALALVFFGTRYAPALYQTFGMLMFAYTVRFLPEAVGTLRARMLQVSPRYEEAARTLGRSHVGALSSITMPLLLPGIIAGAALVFLTTMKELPATLLLAPTGFSTLATDIWGSSSEAMFARAAAPALLLVGVSALSLRLLIRDE